MMSDDNNITGNYKDLKLSNAMLIGLMAGIQRVIGRGGTQAVINMAGEFVGLEMMRFARDQDIQISSTEDLQKYLVEQGLVGTMNISIDEDTISVVISDCYTCPKRVGHYSFDGSACPWTGIMRGCLAYITGEKYSCAAKLTPGESCEIQIKMIRS